MVEMGKCDSLEGKWGPASFIASHRPWATYGPSQIGPGCTTCSVDEGEACPSSREACQSGDGHGAYPRAWGIRGKVVIVKGNPQA
jgi:hypothetical protein